MNDGIEQSCSPDFSESEGIKQVTFIALVPLLSGSVIPAASDDNVEMRSKRLILDILPHFQ